MDIGENVSIEAMREFYLEHQDEIDYNVKAVMPEQIIKMSLNDKETERFERMLRGNMILEMIKDTSRWN